MGFHSPNLLQDGDDIRTIQELLWGSIKFGHMLRTIIFYLTRPSWTNQTKVIRATWRIFGTPECYKMTSRGQIAVDRSLQFSIPDNFCRTDLVALPAGRAGYLVYSKTDRSVHLLPAPTTDLLNVCATFRPLAEHAQSGYNFLEVVQPGPADLREQFVIAKLEELRRLGLLVPESSLKELYRDHGVPEVNPKISSVGVVTHDRVQSLKRCLVSYIDHAKQHERVHNFVVMDDFQHSAVTGTTVEMLHSIKRDHDMEIRYAALMERKQFAEELVKESGLPPEVVNFALFDTERCGSPIGANRNALLLDTVGDLVFSTLALMTTSCATWPWLSMTFRLNREAPSLNSGFFRIAKPLLNPCLVLRRTFCLSMSDC